MNTPTQDTNLSLCPYFKINEGCKEKFLEIVGKFCELVKSEEGCIHYGFTFSGENEAHCREMYKNGHGALAHFKNVGQTLGEALENASLERLEFHGTQEDWDICKEALIPLGTKCFILDARSVRPGV